MANGSKPRPRTGSGIGGRAAFDFLDDPAADDDSISVRGNGHGTGRVADAETDANGQRHMAADFLELATHVGSVEVARTGVVAIARGAEAV